MRMVRIGDRNGHRHLVIGLRVVQEETSLGIQSYLLRQGLEILLCRRLDPPNVCK